MIAYPAVVAPFPIKNEVCVTPEKYWLVFLQSVIFFFSIFIKHS
jgi:hypothetical protein